MISLYAALPAVGEIVYAIDLDPAETAIETRYAGTRPYLAGSVYINPHLARHLARHMADAVHWVVIDGAFVRVHRISIELATDYTVERGVIEVDQSTEHIPFTRIPATGVPGLRVVEPSPPRPPAEWMQAEVERALRDHQAARDMAAAVNEVFASMTGDD
ncbi:hypothetical protein ACW2Q0_28355 [Nocardia sp. R16R-3T]